MLRFLTIQSIALILNFLSALDPTVLVTGFICVSTVVVILLVLMTLFPELADRIALIIDAIKNPYYSNRERTYRRTKTQSRHGRSGRKRG